MDDIKITDIYFTFFWIVMIIGLCLVYTGFITFGFLLFISIILVLIAVLVWKFAAEIEWVLFEKRRFKKEFKKRFSKNDNPEDMADADIDEEEEDYSKIRPRIHPQQYSMVTVLKNRFDQEEKEINSLIEVVFPNPQMTNTKFAGDVEKLHTLFYTKFRSLILFYNNYPVEDEVSLDTVKKGYDDLNKIYNTLMDLKKELSKLLIDDTDVDESLKEIKTSNDNLKNYKYINGDEYE